MLVFYETSLKEETKKVTPLFIHISYLVKEKHDFFPILKERRINISLPTYACFTKSNPRVNSARSFFMPAPEQKIT